MCLIRCNVHITGTPSCPGVSTRPGNHRSDSRYKPRRNHRNREHRAIDGNTTGPEQGGTVIATRTGNTTSVQSPRGDRRPAESNNYPPGTDPNPPACVRPCRLRDTIDDPQKRTGGSPTNPPDSGDRQRSEEGVGRYDQRRPRSQRGGPEFEDAASECAILSRTGSASSPRPTRRQRTEISRLPGLFRVGSNSVEGLDCPTPDGYPPHTQQVSRRAGEHEVRLQSPERDRPEADIATCPRQRRDRARGPTSFYTTPGSSFWGPRPSGHRGTKHEGNLTEEPRILSVLCRVPGYSGRSGLEPFRTSKRSEVRII